MAQFVHPAVSRKKFEAEIATIRKVSSEIGRRGWFLVEADFPTAHFVFAARKLDPPPLVFGALIDFENYDFVPPSVTLIHPLTREPFTRETLRTNMPRIFVSENGREKQLLVQGDARPFVCLQGIREYHENPGHTGDPWFLHRKGPRSGLYYIVENLGRYGAETVIDYNIQLRPFIAGLRLEALE
jgi:hypothetical protein